MGFNGDFMGFNDDFMGFDGDFMGFNGVFMGIHGILSFKGGPLESQISPKWSFSGSWSLTLYNFGGVEGGIGYMSTFHHDQTMFNQC